jgi:hypothetical protein
MFLHICGLQNNRLDEGYFAACMQLNRMGQYLHFAWVDLTFREGRFISFAASDDLNGNIN